LAFPRGDDVRVGGTLRGDGMVEVLSRHETAGEQHAHALAVGVRSLRVDLSAADLRARLIPRRRVVARVDAQQHCAFAHALVVRGVQLDDLAADLGADLDDSRLDERVIRRDPPSRVQPVPDGGDEQHEADRGTDNEKAPFGASRSRGKGRRTVGVDVGGVRSNDGHSTTGQLTACHRGSALSTQKSAAQRLLTRRAGETGRAPR